LRAYRCAPHYHRATPSMFIRGIDGYSRHLTHGVIRPFVFYSRFSRKAYCIYYLFEFNDFAGSTRRS
jgi:hypothetical protein